jgi:hypothetical protein
LWDPYHSFIYCTPYCKSVNKYLNLRYYDNTSSIPIVKNLKSVPRSEKITEKKYPYRHLVGCLSHLANSTRSDILFAVNILSKANHNYSEDHWNLAKYVLKYRKGTIHHGLEFRKSSSDIFRINSILILVLLKILQIASLSVDICCFSMAILSPLSPKLRRL